MNQQDVSGLMVSYLTNPLTDTGTLTDSHAPPSCLFVLAVRNFVGVSEVVTVLVFKPVSALLGSSLMME